MAATIRTSLPSSPSGETFCAALPASDYERLSELIRSNRPEGLNAEGEIRPAADARNWIQHT